MYKVKLNNKSNKMVWDQESQAIIAKFSDGIFETNNLSVAERLQAIGYRVEGILEKSPDPDDERKPVQEPKGSKKVKK